MKKTIWVIVRFDDAARTLPIAAGYRPHFALPGSAHLMGIQFVNFTDAFSFNVPLNAEVSLLYDGVDYSPLSVGTNFEIREGSHVVGSGTVIK